MNASEIIARLNTLVKINSDRINCYERALSLLRSEDVELRPFFIFRIRQSHRFMHDLNAEIRTYASGEEWIESQSMDITARNSVLNIPDTAEDRDHILESCDDFEQAVHKIYRDAQITRLPGYLAELVTEQQVSLQSAHDAVKEKMRHFV